MKKMKVDGKVVTFYTISEVAKASGKEGCTIRKLIERGLLPEANFRSTKTVIRVGNRAGESIPGVRLYSEAIYEDLTRWLRSVRKGSKITPEMSLEVTRLFKSEREKITQL